jgi:hypothetical protein
MQHIARSFAVSLSISHPDIDPVEITEAVGLAPRRTTQAGAPRTTPKGDPLSGTYDFSHWNHEFDVQGASDLGPVLEALVEKLQRHDRFFHRIVREGGEVELFCGVFAAGNWDESLHHALLGRLAALQVNLRLDVYPKADDKLPS